MAVKYITATTLPLLWSVSTNWNNSSLPTSVDDVYTSGKTITINQDITVQTITNAALTSPALTGGGTFSPSGGSWTLNTNISGGSTGSLSCLTISALTTSLTLTISGNTVGGTLAGINGISKTSGGTLNIIGNITGGSSTTSYGLNNNFTQAVNITGNSYTLSVGTGINTTSGTTSMIGDVYNYGNGTGGNGINNTTGVFNLTGNVINSPTSAGLYGINNNGTGTTNVTGIVYGGLNPNTTTYGIYNSTTGRVNVNGTVVGGVAGGNISQTTYGIFNNSTGTVSVTGNVTTNGSVALYNAGQGSINITAPNGIVQSSQSTFTLIQNNGTTPGSINFIGNISGSTSDSPSKGFVIANTNTGIINITGNIVARDAGNSTGIVNQNTGIGTINIVGNISGGSAPNSIAVWLSVVSVLNITGNCYGGSNINISPAIGSNSAVRINISGSCVAGSAYPAVYTTQTGAIHTLNGSMVYTNGISPFLITSNRLQITPTSISPLQSIIMTDTNNNNRYFLTTNTGNTAPISGNVRSDIIYSGFSPSETQYTGSCIVPSYSSVTLNVPTDNGYGTSSGMTINNLSAMISSYLL